MHPFCRSSTIPVLPSEEDLDRIIQQDGDAIGADVDFEEWKSHLVETKDGKFVYRVDNSAESGIIKVGSGNSMSALSRKYKSANYVEPMPKKQFRAIKKAFQRHGGVIQQNDETDAYLDKKHAEGITYNSKTILLKQNPGRASVFEELIHSTQYRQGMNDGSVKSCLLNEIEAQNKLIKYAKEYKLTEPEIQQTKEALKKYQEELEKYLSLNGGD